jgi:hypothetical protein
MAWKIAALIAGLVKNGLRLHSDIAVEGSATS